VIIDPLSAYLGGVDSHSDVHRLLAPLADLAQRWRVAVVVTHTSKGRGAAMCRSLGSLPLMGAARTGWACVQDPHDPARRLLLSVKNNLTRHSTGLSYSIVERSGAPCIAWLADPVAGNVDDVLAVAQGGGGAERRDAEEWLRQSLAQGPMPVKDLQQAAREAGPSWATVRRAKAALRVQAYREGFGASGHWLWRLAYPPFGENAQTSTPRDVSDFGENEHPRNQMGTRNGDGSTVAGP